MNNVKLYEQFIAEAKNMGAIYHFTSIEGLMGILESDKLKAGEFDYLSFTRNSRLNFQDFGVRLTFDGDRMSDKFHFEPYMYDGRVKLDADKRRMMFGEERILKKEITGVKK
jgi:hypothetical protein